MAIVASASVADFFGLAVDDAMRARNVVASDGARSYVVALLTDLAKPGSAVERTLDRPLTLLLDEALNTPELGERFDRLRTLGDGVLYSSGFFADHFEARGVDPSYLVGIGRTAYERAGALIVRGSQPLAETPPEDEFDLFKELARGFGRFVEVIAAVANATVASGVASSRSLLRLYERWLKTGDSTLADALTSHGFVAARGGRGLS